MLYVLSEVSDMKFLWKNLKFFRSDISSYLVMTVLTVSSVALIASNLVVVHICPFKNDSPYNNLHWNVDFAPDENENNSKNV